LWKYQQRDEVRAEFAYLQNFVVSPEKEDRNAIVS